MFFHSRGTTTDVGSETTRGGEGAAFGFISRSSFRGNPSGKYTPLSSSPVTSCSATRVSSLLLQMCQCIYTHRAPNSSLELVQRCPSDPSLLIYTRSYAKFNDGSVTIRRKSQPHCLKNKDGKDRDSDKDSQFLL